MKTMPDLLMLGIILLLGFLCQWFAWRIQLPAILFLLLTGILLGPTFSLLDPNALFGDLLFPFVSLSVAIILFEGSLTLKSVELRDIGPCVRNMVSYGALLNATVTTTATHYLTGLSWSISALFGAIMVVTGPTVIMPMLRSVRPSANIAKVLRWEGIVIDPLGALLAVLIFEWIAAQQTSADLLHVISIFGQTIGLGIALGILTGHCFGLLLRHHLIPEYLQNFAAIAFVIAAFSGSNTLLHESGLLTVTIMGIWLTNMKGVHTRNILNFKETLTVIFVSSLFIILAARINFESLLQLGWGAVAVLVVMQFLARPIKVFICTIGSNFSFNERLLLAWIGPRGIVAAAVSVVFALRLEQLGMANADLLVPLAFSIIIGTVVIQSATARPLAKLLNVNEPDTQGFLIIGANPVAIIIARALKMAEIKTILCDTEWENICAARMVGLQTYYGNPISDHADLHLEVTSLGGMLGLSNYHSQNTAAALRFREDFGIRNIFTLASKQDEKPHNKHRASEFYKGKVLFDESIRYNNLNSFINEDTQVKSTQLTDTYDYSDWKSDNNSKKSILLFAIDPNNRLHWLTADNTLSPTTGWCLYALRNIN
ncbi:sodium:proton antiporter [Motiliproteus sp. MSK22-1]|uniref:cation:proton antiporter n=1 Tax=Motiliproteus sp. MSK22-1 TaxID=1897630 RepID=UPI000978069E|nr:sodium:proton antiporter [Motiliproteus sp. MSK22-1]OMH28469.1 sodium:proton antiporter [Motiliproteus sp. MSK22-1]